MKLYDGGPFPNPRRVTMFVAEKGIDVPTEAVDMTKLEHQREPVSSLNPMQRLPVLELDDGTAISETIAICRYLEALHPDPNLFGSTPEEIATIEMWQRRLELYFLLPVAYAFRHLHPGMAKAEVPQIKEFGEANKPKALDFARFLDGHLEGKDFIAADRFTVADITGIIAADFTKKARITIPDELTNVHRWANAMRERPSYPA